MVVIFGDTGRRQDSSSYLLNMVIRHPVSLFFALVTSTDGSLLVASNFTAFCKEARLAENIEFNHLITNCQRLVQSTDNLDWMIWKHQSKREIFLGVVARFKDSTCLYDALNYAMRYLADSGNVSKQMHAFTIEARIPDRWYNLLNNNNDIMDNFPILVGNWSFSFVTCSSMTQGRIDYWGYVKPFDTSVWYVLIAFCLFLMMVLLRQNYAKYEPLPWYELCHVAFNSALEVGLTVVEKPSSTLMAMFPSPASLKLITLWMLGSFVVVNIYKSIVTEDTTAPLVFSPPKTFDHLVNGKFQIYSSIIPNYIIMRETIPQTLTNWRVSESEFDAEINFHFSAWLHALSEPLQSSVSNLMARHLCPVTMNMSSPQVEDPNIRYFCSMHKNWASYLDKNRNLINQVEAVFANLEFGRIASISQVLNLSRISEIIARCNKTAFVAPTIYIKSRRYLLNILGGEKSYLNQKPYLKSTDTIFSSRMYILIPKLGAISDGLKVKIAKLIESGLYQFWENFFVYLHTGEGSGDTWEDRFLQQQLNSNILSIFLMLSFSICVCAVIFIFEIWIGMRHRILDGVRIFVVRCNIRMKNCNASMKILRMRLKPGFGIEQKFKAKSF